VMDGASCGSDSDTECDSPDTCDGMGGCQDNNEADGTACGTQGMECFEDDECVSGACQDNGFQEAGTPCSDDGEFCTDDSCNEIGECVHTPSCLDIKPASCPNPVNAGSNGLIPIALIGSPGFDVSDVDLDTLELSRVDGVGGSVIPWRTKIRDVATPFAGELCDCHEFAGDGILDVLMKYRMSETAAALRLAGLPHGTILELQVTGNLLDGSPFAAIDCVVVVGGEVSSLIVTSNMFDTLVEVAPLDLTVDGDGFADFGRAYPVGTWVTVTAPTSSSGHRFVRWIVNGALQPIGQRTLEVEIASEVNLDAIYARSSRLEPDRPIEFDGDMD